MVNTAPCGRNRPLSLTAFTKNLQRACPRDWPLSASWGEIKGCPINIKGLRNITVMMYKEIWDPYDAERREERRTKHREPCQHSCYVFGQLLPRKLT